ncbi:MAG: DUF4252 domain-containing protein [Bryobacteraceae bacterium]
MSRLKYLLVCASLGVAAAQPIHEMVPFQTLAPKASQSVEVNLDGNLLNMARRFLSDSRPDEAQAKKLLGNVKGIYVRVLEFDKPGEYSKTDVDNIMSKVRGAGWQRVVDVKEKNGENTGVFLKSAGEEIEGIVVVAAEPKELTIVNIVGSIQPEQLRELGGRFGIPEMKFENRGSSKKKDD